MSAQTEHKLHHEKHTAYGSGPHNHHRGMILHDGIRVGFSKCDLSPFEDRHCPDDPDPWVLLQAKAEAERARLRLLTIPVRDRCRYGHGPDEQDLNAQGRAFCRECRRLAGVRARLRKAANGIVAAALAA